MASKYYDPDAILTEAQKAPCTFELTVPELSALNAGSTVEVGTKLDLPLWLAEMLAMSKPAGPSSSLASMDVPSALGPKVMAALAAGPKSVDIRAQAQWFYGMGERILNLFDDEELADVLSKTFRERALEIADKAQNTRSMGEGDEFMRGLERSERELFRAAHEGNAAVKKWSVTSSRP
ncbi:DNA replication complex GINS protein PSF3 [Fulvia fulva]|uniref:DNA replication complex GINS protein PSF3 n=1 Tax=Passalora fulva TaxID=5499 RepID=A0A9Q8LHI1_PASFU|nr:DNA replication complex GINS protein PSF3 [Fulvia fulva]KAK4623694.1 DNA replication complex GINS protein PSF3 [Fulvia fulva]KAK4624801.1 DNA replication complex GINS protein PSF3 [Fulvia fulva]UJO17542.1 DNA replication complex GINS protein PSF3 [Fulvia fulva]WPV15453.1 DNA replication complex GINS protein PSF3 [Fulvia fulva]WPV29369.1 DNA replication complex GINS protein PSF3 [Fulvia fulva]